MLQNGFTFWNQTVGLAPVAGLGDTLSLTHRPRVNLASMIVMRASVNVSQILDPLYRDAVPTDGTSIRFDRSARGQRMASELSASFGPATATCLPMLAASHSDLFYRTYAPTGPASLVVSQYWVVRAADCRVAVEAFLPDVSFEIHINIKSGERLVAGHHCRDASVHRAAWVLTPRPTRLLVEKHAFAYELVGVRLKPGVVQDVLGSPASALPTGSLDLEELWGPAVHAMRDELIAAPDSSARCRVLDREIGNRVAHRNRIDVAVPATLYQVLGGNSNEAVADVARRYGIAHRRLIAMFDSHVGLKPKHYDRVRRLRRVLRTIGPHRTLSWAAIAARAGYTDQAHLIHEFHRLTGLTPTECEARRLAIGDGLVCHKARAG